MITSIHRSISEIKHRVRSFNLPVASRLTRDRSELRDPLDCAPTRLSDLDLPSVDEYEWEWDSGWYTINDVVRGPPACLQPDMAWMPEAGRYVVFYEYRGDGDQWHIGYATCEDVLGPYTERTHPLFAPSGDDGCPAETGIADPTVLRIDGADPPWHMWFDMRDGEGVWRLGHATSYDGIDWQIQRDTDGRPEIVVDIGRDGEWDDGFVHAPEAFVYDGRVRLVYNAQGTGHYKYDGGLAVAADEEGHGYAFEKVGQTTFDDTALGGRDIRVRKPIRVNDAFYAIHGRDTIPHATLCRSTDGCESWDIVCKFPYPYANALLISDGHILCLGGDQRLHVKRLPPNLHSRP